MEITGKIILALPEQSGVSKAGNSWKKKEYVLETLDTYPKKVHFDFFGEKADQFPLSVGQTVKLSFDIESREYNGRWFTSIRGWKAEAADQQQPQQTVNTTVSNNTVGTVPPPPDITSNGASDDLPF
ncbi:MAG: DUF3127 domain-containing protein [Muribaculaceae bacterium]